MVKSPVGLVCCMEVSVAGEEIQISRSLLFILLFAVGLIAFGTYDYVGQRQTVQDAVEVDATVTAAGIDEGSVRGGIDYYPNVTFEYRYEGVEYTGDDVFPGSFNAKYGNVSEAESIIEQYPVGETVTAYVDPDSPEEAYLKNKTNSNPLTFMGMGVVVLLLGILKGRANAEHGNSEEDRGSTAGYERYDGSPTVLGFDNDTVGMFLKRLIVASFLAIFLSLVGIFVFALSTESDAASTTQLNVFEPAGFVFFAAFLSGCSLITSLLGYAGWSYRESRHLKRTKEAENHQSLLSIILADNKDLNEYEKRVRITAVSLLIGLFLLAVLLNILGIFP